MTRLAAALCLACLAALPAPADTGVTFAGLKTDPNAPVHVTSDELQLSEADGKATFTGHVVVTQSDLVMKAATVNVVYGKDGKSIAELDAAGGVTVRAGETAASSDAAVYTVPTSALKLTGHVLLSQKQATLSGDTLLVDLKTGLGTFKGRVTTTFNPSPKPAGGSK